MRRDDSDRETVLIDLPTKSVHQRMELPNSLVAIIEAILDGRLAQVDVKSKPDSAVCVVMASGGYPGSYAKGKAIAGIVWAAARENVLVFHAGTALKGGKVVTDGGRVLGVPGIGPVVAAAIDNAYAAVRDISFEGAHYRKDIGPRALEGAI